MNTATVDFRHITGVMKPMHGVGSAPMKDGLDSMFHYLKEAGIPYSRLHDTGGMYAGGRFVDIPNVFRNFDADPEDPKSYDFAFTDWLLAALDKQGVRPFYRLGVTIENFHYVRAYHIFPPKDAMRWARICAGIVRHYTQGWADGFHYDIPYWEIWNEPDNSPDIAENPMWKGTPEEYFHLYEVTSNELKREFPQIKVGGYASCGFYALLDTDVSETAHVDKRQGFFIDFFHQFLDHIRRPGHESPLDFFSWHSYAGIEENIRFARYVRDTLDKCGFSRTESILDEWNPGVCNRGTQKDAALVAGMLCAMQKAPVDLCTYYDAQLLNVYGGLFDPVKFTGFKAYHSFRAFNELYRLHHEVFSAADGEGLYVCAAADQDARAALLVNTSGADRNVALRLKGVSPDETFDVMAVDGTRDLEKTSAGGCRAADGAAGVAMPAYSVLLLRARQSAASAR